MKELIVSAIQLPTLGMNATRLEFYLKNATSRGAKLILFGEYVLNHFFRELESIPKSMVQEQTKKHLEMLQKMAKEYDVTFIAPIVRVEKKSIYKTIAKISPDSLEFYNQQILMPYKHWNEEKFFNNKIAPIKKPMIFKIDGIKVAVIGGYELHFDPIWQKIHKSRVDLVLIPTASTFGSHNRWRTIIKSRAFLHGVYILRANRLGEYIEEGGHWRFYGDSMLVNPEGEVEMMLEDKESMLVEPIDKAKVKEHRKVWKFSKALRERGEI